jgi:hypothetical protein
MRGADDDGGALFHDYSGPDTSANPSADARQTVPQKLSPGSVHKEKIMHGDQST